MGWKKNRKKKQDDFPRPMGVIEEPALRLVPAKTEVEKVPSRGETLRGYSYTQWPRGSRL